MDEVSAEASQLSEVKRAQRGDRSAFATLVKRVQRPVYGLCLRLLKQEAEAAEAAQEAFLRAWQNLDRFDESRPFEVWVLAIARNLCLDVLRRRTKGPTEDIAELPLASDAQSQEEQAIQKQEHLSLEQAISTLSVDDREVLALYYVQKRTTKAIAEVLGVAPGTIMARLFRAREKLRVKLTAHQAVPEGA